MKRIWSLLGVLLAFGLAGVTARAQTYVTPMMGGDQVSADMIHIDIYYDVWANELHALVDDSYGTPMLRPLEPGYAFDPLQPYAVLNGKAYNSQYGWNVGGFFSLPPGSKIWIELLDSSPGLEAYEEHTYVPIFGTAGSSRLWRWAGRMVHNTYAVRNPPVGRLFAEYHVYIGDENTGSRANFVDFDDTTVRLEWTVVPIEDPMTFKFGAVSQTNHAPLNFNNAEGFVTASQAVLNLHFTNGGPRALQYTCPVSMMAVPASTGNGGPATNPAALGSHLELELVSLVGPGSATLTFWEEGQAQPSFSLRAGELAGTNRVALTQTCGAAGAPGADPYGCIPGRHFALSKPGLYCLGFRVIDTSTNGPGGGPIHSPSPVYQVNLQAGITIACLSRQGSTAIAMFGGEPGRTFYLERISLGDPSSSWKTVGGPLAGTNRLQTLTDTAATGSKGFYRLRAN